MVGERLIRCALAKFRSKTKFVIDALRAVAA